MATCILVMAVMAVGCFIFKADIQSEPPELEMDASEKLAIIHESFLQKARKEAEIELAAGADFHNQAVIDYEN